MMKKRNKQKQKSVFLFCIVGCAFLTFLTCVDSDSKSQNINRNLEYQEKQNLKSKIGLSTFSPKSEMKTDNDFALAVLGKLSVGTSKTFYVNGPLADVCVGTLKNEGNFKVTGKLFVGTLQNTGEIKYEDFQEGITCPQVFPPSVTDFIRGQKVIRFGEGWVEEYDRDGSLIRRIEGKFYVDPSGAEWVYRNDGSWGMKGDKPSELEGYSLVFETDFRNPAKRLDVYDGGIYVKGKMKDSGNLVVRDKPDEWSVVVLGDGFFTSDIDIIGRVYIGGDMRLVGEDEREFQGEYRYKIKGDLFVKGDFTSNVNFSINNIKLVQKVADVAVMLEVPGGEALEWVQTTPVGDPKPGEPGVAVVVYRVPPEVSLAPPMSRLTSKTAVAKKDIHKLRSVYRKAERGEMNIVLSAGRILRKSEGGQTNPLEELKEENLVSIVIGDSVNYGTILMVSGLPVNISGLYEVINTLKSYGYQNIKVLRTFYIPLHFFAVFEVDGQILDPILIYPIITAGALSVVSQQRIDEIGQFLDVERAKEEPRRIRDEEWEFFRKVLAGEIEITSAAPPAPAPTIAPNSRIEPKGLFKCKADTKVKALGSIDPPIGGKDYWYIPWVFTQDKIKGQGACGCGPAAASQLFTYWRTEKDKYCIEYDIPKLAKRLFDEMKTSKILGECPTLPAAMRDGIVSAADSYGYSAWAGYIVDDTGDLQDEIDDRINRGEPVIFLTLLSGPIKFHYYLIAGYKWKEWHWSCLSFDQHYLYLFDNHDTKLIEWRFDDAVYGLSNVAEAISEGLSILGWSIVVVNPFNEKYTYYRDADRDRYGNPNEPKNFCDSSPPSGYELSSSDCDDSDPQRNPGLSEWCDYKDNNCNGQVDEGVRPTFWRDEDGDGYGNPSKPTNAFCPPPPPPQGWVSNNTDCNDSNSSVHPGAQLDCGSFSEPDFVDNDCDGNVEKWYCADADGDGFGYPHLLITCLCSNFPISGAVWTTSANLDCDDSNPDIHPGAAEVCNYVDDDCDGQVDEYLRPILFRDSDGDGYGNPNVTTTDYCLPVAGWVFNNWDCNDNNPSVYPGAPEICDGLDNNCDGSIPSNEADSDGDGYRICAGDCNDNNNSVYPGAPLYCGPIDNPDTVDNDCDGKVERWYFPDQDGDGYGTAFIVAGCTPISENLCVPILIPMATCSNTQPAGTATVAGDCNDNPNDQYAKYIHPGQCEVCDGGVDDDCDGADESSDPDAGKCGEYCGNRIDDDCDGEVDESNCKSCAVVPETNSYLQNLIPLFLSYIILIILRGKGRFKIKKFKSVFSLLLFTVSILIPFVVKAEDTTGKIPKGIKHPDFYVFSSEDKMMYVALSKEVFVKSGGKVKIEKVNVPGALRAYKIEFSEGYPISFALMYERGEIRDDTFFGFLGNDGKFEKIDFKVDKEKQIISGQTNKPGIIGIFIRGSN